MISETEPLYNKIITVPNIISFVRLCLIPLYLALLFCGFDVAAFVVFAVAAASDFVDGQVARRTHQVSKLGKLLDPAIDTLLMMSGVIACYLVGRCPLWIAILIFAREIFLLAGGGILLKARKITVPVIYPGKFATTFLFIGFAGLILNAPIVPGLGLCDIQWLPGLTSAPVPFFIWSVYIGLVLQIGVTLYYCYKAIVLLREQNEKMQKDRMKSE